MLRNNNEKITHIICDFSDVLVKGIEGVEVPLSKALKVSETEIRETLFKFDFNPLWLGEISEVEFLQLILKKFEWSITLDDLKDLIRANFYRIDASWEIYRQLSKIYNLILFSVNAKEWVEYLNLNNELRAIFEERIHYSYDAKLTKRSQEGFQYILNTYNVDPMNCLFIDDSSKNIEIAKSLGIESIKFTSPKQLNSELRKLNLLY